MMMDDGQYEEVFDLSSMTEDEKDEAIINLSEKVNSTYTAAASLFNAMQLIAVKLDSYNRFGVRKNAITDAAYRLRLISNLSLPSLGYSLQELREAAEFDDIISRFEEDDDE